MLLGDARLLSGSDFQRRMMVQTSLFVDAGAWTTAEDEVMSAGFGFPGFVQGLGSTETYDDIRSAALVRVQDPSIF